MSKEHIITLSIKSEYDHPEQWDWPTLLDVQPEDVKVLSFESFEEEQ